MFTFLYKTNIQVLASTYVYHADIERVFNTSNKLPDPDGPLSKSSSTFEDNKRSQSKSRDTKVV